MARVLMFCLTHAHILNNRPKNYWMKTLASYSLCNKIPFFHILLRFLCNEWNCGKCSVFLHVFRNVQNACNEMWACLPLHNFNYSSWKLFRTFYLNCNFLNAIFQKTWKIFTCLFEEKRIPEAMEIYLFENNRIFLMLFKTEHIFTENKKKKLLMENKAKYLKSSRIKQLKIKQTITLIKCLFAALSCFH